MVPVPQKRGEKNELLLLQNTMQSIHKNSGMLIKWNLTTDVYTFVTIKFSINEIALRRYHRIEEQTKSYYGRWNIILSRGGFQAFN